MTATDTKAALLASAERVARRHGFNGFSYADLAADVGITKASIHHHFPSKAALSTALMQTYHANFLTICRTINRAHSRGADRLAALIAQYRDALEGGQSLCLCVAFSISAEHLSSETLREMARFRSMMIEWLSATFAQGKADGSIGNVASSDAEAAATLALLEGAQLSTRVTHDLGRFDTATQTLLGRLTTA